MRKRSVLCILLLFVLFACSNDDGPNPSEEPQGTLQGVFIDSPVSGLNYETETHSGVTDENGEFNYEVGETVTFYVGDIKLGTAPAAEEISPISIATTPNADINTLEVQNIAAFLQTLDEDGDPDNGIKISPDIVATITGLEIDFSASIVQILGEIAIQIFQSTGVSLEVVYPERAAAHLASSLDIAFEPTDLFSYNFLPAFTKYFEFERHYNLLEGSSRALLWVHEFDNAGKLIKSIAYEKYPFRVLSQFDFLNYDQTNYSVDLQIQTNNYNDWTDYATENYKVKFSSDYLITELIPGIGATSYERKEFQEFNSENWVTSIASYNYLDELVSNNSYEYDSIGNLIKLESFGINGNLKFSHEFNYSDFNEVTSGINIASDNAQSSFVYNYREDLTLEKIEESFSDGFSTFSFSEDEKLMEWIISYANGYKIVFTYEATEKVEQNFYDGVLTDIYYYRYENGNYSGWIYKYEWFQNGILRDRTVLNENYNKESYEYFDDNGNLEYKDFYDQEGNWIYKEYYDDQGNVTNTEYPN